MKNKILEVLKYIGIIVLTIVVVALMVFSVWVRIEFAETPLSDIPGWALPFIK
jgi:hypothetical protein